MSANTEDNANTIFNGFQLIERKKTYDAIRGRYGTVREFCAQAETSTAFLSLVLTGQRGRRHSSKGAGLLRRLEAEGLLVLEAAA